MGLYERLESDMKTALKGRNATALSTVRMLLADIRNRAIEKKVDKLDDEGIAQVIQKHVRQHKDSIEQFKKGNRADLAEKEELELKVLNGYLPEQLSDEDLIRMIDESIKVSGAANPSDFGKVMKAVMGSTKGQADGKLVSRLVKERLSKKKEVGNED
ncbi:GatB/YqeY domain-containing protein [Candidatus Omnitrophota bacterium]